jgi:hypothetical protein
VPVIGWQQLVNLRSAIDSQRQAVSLNPFPWTDTLSSNTPIRAIHFQEIRHAQQDVWARKNMGTFPAWTSDPDPSPGAPARETSPTDLETTRSAIAANNNKPKAQGIVSITADADGFVVADLWCDDAYNLKPRATTPSARQSLMIRTAVQGSNEDPPSAGPFVTGVGRWQASNRQMSVGCVFPWDFLSRHSTEYNPNGTLSDQIYNPQTNTYSTDPNGRKIHNKYIDTYVYHLGQFAASLIAVGVTTFWVWNEPQAATNLAPTGLLTFPGSPEEGGYGLFFQKIMSPQTFGSLSFLGATKLRQLQAATVYLGSLHLLPGVTGPAHGPQYIDQMYSYLTDPTIHTQPVTPGEFPWTGSSFNMQGDVRSSSVLTWLDNQMLTPLNAVFTKHSQSNQIVVLGEWGLKPKEIPFQETGVPDKLEHTFDNLEARFPILYFFSHDPVEEYGVTHRTFSSSGQIEPNGHLHVGDPPTSREVFSVLQSLYARLDY